MTMKQTFIFLEIIFILSVFSKSITNGLEVKKTICPSPQMVLEAQFQKKKKKLFLWNDGQNVGKNRFKWF